MSVTDKFLYAVFGSQHRSRVQVYEDRALASELAWSMFLITSKLFLNEIIDFTWNVVSRILLKLQCTFTITFIPRSSDTLCD